jgi:V8-like Glu-specific endopeptidase
MKRIIFSIACACAVSAFAQDSKTTQPKASGSPMVMTESEARSALQYWTPERMSAARPMPLPEVDPSSIEATGRPVVSGPARHSAGGLPTIHLAPSTELREQRFPLNTGSEDSADDHVVAESDTFFNYEMPFQNYRTGVNNSYPYTTIGKLFFTIPEGATEPAGDYVCSASVAMDKHTVVTARHCVYDINTHKWYGNWQFFPGWNNGSDATLGGEWTVNFAYTWTSNGGNSAWYWDIAFLSMHDHDGKGCGGSTGSAQIGAYTGWLGWWYGGWDGNYVQRQWNIFGYPQASPFEGNYLYEDNGATGQLDPQGADGIVEVGNPQTGGTSGGPWILGFDPYQGANPTVNNNLTPAGDYNMINGVNSFKWTSPNHPLSINGAEFNTDNFSNLYTDYQNYGHCS